MARWFVTTLWLAALLACAPIALRASPAQSKSQTDFEFAHAELAKTCAALIELKKIDWPAVARELAPAAAAAQTDQEHLVVLVRLLARLRDGHAEVRLTEASRDVTWPNDARGPLTGCGMFWCTSNKKVFVKSAWNAAAAVGIEPGWEVLSVAGVPVAKWIERRQAELSDRISFSTDQQARFFTMHQGLAEPVGTQLELEFKDEKGAKKKRTVGFTKAATGPWGAAFSPPDLAGDDDVRFGRTERGFGYVHIRRCKDNLPTRMDEALAAIGDTPGLILDFRANGGGGFDHEALMGRFVPAGETLRGGVTYASAGPHPYGGRIVVIVDAGVRSAGETGAGIFKEDGRAYMIGESATAGMSSQKTEIELPSGLFKLYVSIGSNKGRFNQGRGIEGIGVVPHELVPYAPADLAAKVDTLIRRAETLLAKFPDDKVPFKPKR